jgi:pyroglutamyl-peptidase
MGAFRAEMLPVAYETVMARLTEIGRAFQPDIAVHFGLAQSCSGFRLERVARNRFVPVHPDNLGFIPEVGPICAGPETLDSRLPLEAIHGKLSAAGLPVEWSDDAGGYLCNAVFTLSLARGAEDFHPAMSGFVHVPLLSEVGHDASARRFEQHTLLDGARIILQTSVDAFIACNEKGPA